MAQAADLVHQRSSSTGTGSLTLAAVNGRRTFSAAFGTGTTQNVFDYFVSNPSADEWERGTGHMSNSTTLVRDTVLESSNSNAAVSFSGGILDVMNDVPAAKQVTTDAIQTLTNKTLMNPIVGTQSARDNSATAASTAYVDGATRDRLTADRTYYVRANLGICTISNASPGVVTLNGHGLLATDPVVFNTSGSLPTGLTSGTIYYVVNPTTNTFQVAATVGGVAINTTSVGSGTHSVATGNDSNSGFTQNRAGAFLTPQKGWDTICDAIDLAGHAVTLQLADSLYSTGITSSKGVVGSNGGSDVIIKGNVPTPANCVISTTSTSCFEIGSGVNGEFKATITGFELRTTTSGFGIRAFGGGCGIRFNNIRFGACAEGWIYGAHSAFIIANGPFSLVGNTAKGFYAQTCAQIALHGQTVTYENNPVFNTQVYADRLGAVFMGLMTYVNSGTVTGQRYVAASNGIVDTLGGGASSIPGTTAGATATGGQYI